MGLKPVGSSLFAKAFELAFFTGFVCLQMAPAMKAMKAKAVASISKTELVAALETESAVKKSDCKKVLESLAEVAAKEVKKGKFIIPGVAMVKTRLKPATKAGKKEIFGKLVMVKAKPAKTIVKAFPMAALKKAV